MAEMGQSRHFQPIWAMSRFAPKRDRLADNGPCDQFGEPLLMDLANAGVKFDAFLALHMVRPSPFTEGVFRRRSVAERGRRRLQAWVT